MSRGRKRGRMAINYNDNDVAKNLDKLSKYEEFKDEILPKIRKMLKDGKKAPEIRAFAQAYLTARQVTIGLTSENEAAALKAIDALTHQHEGKPTERTETTHKFEKLKDEELDSVLLSYLEQSKVKTVGDESEPK